MVPVEAVKYNFEVKSTLNAIELKTTISKFVRFQSIGGDSPTVLFLFSTDHKGSELERLKSNDSNFFVNADILAFGISQLLELGKSLQSFLVNTPINSNLKEQTLYGAISFSYVASILWVLSILVVSSAYSLSINTLVPEIALAFTYAFILAELVLRPLKKRLEFLQL